MKAVSDRRGVIAAAAMDQRGSLQKALAKESGGQVGDAMILNSRRWSRSADAARECDSVRSEGASVRRRRAKNSGLLLAYEKTGYDANTPGRQGDLLNDWSVRRLKEVGADCIKILLYYAPSDPPAINTQKHAWVERIGDECRANDIPFFLELIGYEEGIDEKGLEYAKKKPDVVAQSMKEFSQERYGVDVLKVEVPINMKFVQGSSVNNGEFAYTRKEAKRLFLKTAKAAKKPFIYLSAGVSNAEFTESLALAGESGVRFSGVLWAARH
jgi:tagatose 1,6-diphosphate aldolase